MGGEYMKRQGDIPELKSCPFCGGEAEINSCGRIVRKKRIPFFQVRCVECRTHHPKFSHTITEAVENWNRRPGETTVNQYGENCTHITNCGTLNLNL